MNMKRKEGSFRPTQQQELLLHAALLKGREALDAWKEWRSRVDIDDIDRLDPGSYRILPLLYRNLNNQGVEDPLMMRLKGVYRLTWYKNQMLFHTIANLLRSFHDAGIKTMVLKGAALTVVFYKDYGLRPMDDFDVLVRTEQAIPAINLLKKLGWKPKSFEPTEEYITVSYSHGFHDGADREFDLHWHVLSQNREGDSDDDFWEGAIEIKIHDVPTHALNPADQLLHICIHGTKWDVTPTLRWVEDAITILTTLQSEIDWNRLIAQAEKRRLILPLQDTLIYLRDTFNAPIASEILQSIKDIPVPKIERIEYKITVSPPTRWTAVLDLWCQHSRLTGNTSVLHKLIKFPGFLQNIWGLSLWKIPFYGIFKMITWSKNRLSGEASQK
jgi:hypothetical protein